MKDLKGVLRVRGGVFRTIPRNDLMMSKKID
jgi:hypothetical protein